MDQLPDLPLTNIFLYLEPRDICRVARTCTAWYHVSCSNAVWKPILRKYCIDFDDGEESCKEVYKRWYSTFHSVAEEHRRIRPLFIRLENWLRKHAPHILQTLQDGCSVRELDQLENILHVSLPNDFRCMYLLHNGQDVSQPNTALFGGYHFYHQWFVYYMNPLSSLVELNLKLRANSLSSWIEHSILLCFSGWFLATSDFTFNGVKIKRGMIFTISKQGNKCFPIAESFYALLADYVNKLEDGTYQVLNGSIQLFPMKNIPEAITRGLRIRTSFVFVPMLSAPISEYLWAYRIFMDMDETWQPASHYECKLVSRHWRIKDACGREEEVQGPGVIGLYPECYPGMELFYYESCCPLTTSSGEMSGTFQMRVRSSGEMFDAIVPAMKFCVPPIITEPKDK